MHNWVHETGIQSQDPARDSYLGVAFHVHGVRPYMVGECRKKKQRVKLWAYSR